VTTTARAEVVTGPCAAVTDPNNAPSTDPRIDHLVVDGTPVNVLVPPHYRRDGRRYPVVYLFHGAFSDEDSFETQTDLLAFTAALDDDDQAIAVIPAGGYLPIGDYANGTHPQETFVIDTLIPFVDAHYRTLARRAFRAAAGFSAGGLDAMLFSAHHPDLFVAAGSFSGFVDPFTPSGEQVAQLVTDQDDQLCGGSLSWFDFWGDPTLHPMGWEAGDPTYLVGNLRDLALYVGSNNGVPCPDNPNPDPFTVFAETVVYGMSQTLDQDLTSAGIAHVTDFLSCGVHLFSNADHDLRVFWPQMSAAFGRPDPRQFSYRTADAVASVWGWTFAADPARAPEFLDARDVCRDGLTLTGSGTESVTTPRSFLPGELVTIEGAASGAMRVRADGDGRLTFPVDLGPPHALEQDTAAEVVAQASDPGYFVTRRVRFDRVEPGR
jgi:S-formylglutathione hydrolase FrmB